MGGEALDDEDLDVDIKREMSRGGPHDSDPALTLSRPTQLVLRSHNPSSSSLTRDDPRINQDDGEKARQQEAQGPMEIVNVSDVDPFASMAAELPAHFLAEVMDKIRIILLRQVTDQINDDYIASNFTGQTMRQGVHNKALFYCLSAAALRFTRIARNDMSIPLSEVAIEARSIELLSREMASLETALTEASIVAIVACGYCGKVYPMRKGRLPRQSFLRQLQDLNTYGRMVIQEAHVAGLSRLIPMMGGIYNLKTPGLAPLISFCDLFDSTRKLQCPAVPFVPHTQTFLRHDRSTGYDSAMSRRPPDLEMLGMGFGISWNAPPQRELLHLIAVTTQLADFTGFMDNFLEGRHRLEEPVELTDFRNYCQHQLMSLPSAKSLKITGQLLIDVHYEACRLACIAYSLLVVFPLPPTVGFFEKLARRMRLEVSYSWHSHEELNIHQRNLRFWMLMMATVISTGLTERDFFLQQLANLVRRLDVKSWQQAMVILKQFLWHPSTNNRDGQSAWANMQDTHPAPD